MYGLEEGYSTEVPLVPRRKKVDASPAMIIFHRYYRIQISGLHLLDEQFLEQFGSVTTGNAREDVAMQSSARHAQVTIAQMAELLAEGATFTLTDYEKGDEIFDLIQQHLGQWSRVVQSSFNANDVPIEGLRELEELAQYLYPYVMRKRKATRVESHLYRSLLDMVTARQSIVARAVEQDQTAKEAQEIEPYQSITSDLTRTLERRDQLWK